jgi:hypothetical protein
MIRLLTLDEMKIVAGGTYDSDSSISNPGGDSGGPYGGGGGDAPGDAPPPPPPSTPGAVTAVETLDVDQTIINFVEYVDSYGIQTDTITLNQQEGNYNSTDSYAPSEIYGDYFASQHGPDSIAIRAQISADAFFNYASNYQNIAYDVAQIVNASTSTQAAQAQVDAYLNSVGLAGQVHVDIGSGAILGGLSGISNPYGDDIVVNGYTPHYEPTLPSSYYQYADNPAYYQYVGGLPPAGVDETVHRTPDWGHGVGVVDPITHLPVRSATGALLLWPSGINPTTLFNIGRADGMATAIMRDPSLFRQNGLYDFQRSGSTDGKLNHPEFIDASTVGIGIYNRAANVPLDTILSIQNIYASQNSHYPPGTVMDPHYTSLPARNVQNTIIGYQLASHIIDAANSY